MLIYYGVFLISTFFVYLAERKKTSKIKSAFMWLIAILGPTFLAAVRAETVGTDTSGYVKEIFELCKNGTDWKYIVGAYQCEIGYYWINYMVSYFTDSFQILLFVIQILVLMPVIISCKNNKDLVEPYISYLFFLVLFYNRTLNMTRQSIAISFCILAVTFMRKQEIRKFLLCVIIAMTMHRIAILFIFIYFLYYFLQKKDRVFYKFLFSVIAILVLIFYQTIVVKLVDLGYISKRYLYYANSGNQNISTIELLTKVIFLIIILITSKYLNKKNKDNGFLIFILILDILVYCIGFYANYAQRISYYLGFFVIFIIPQVPKCMKMNQRRVCLFFLLAISFVFSYCYYGINECDGTVPYMVAQIM